MASSEGHTGLLIPSLRRSFTMDPVSLRYQLALERQRELLDQAERSRRSQPAVTASRRTPRRRRLTAATHRRAYEQ